MQLAQRTDSLHKTPWEGGEGAWWCALAPSEPRLARTETASVSGRDVHVCNACTSAGGQVEDGRVARHRA